MRLSAPLFTLLLAGPARAQTPADSVGPGVQGARPVVAYGQGLTLREIQRETARLVPRPVAPDSAVTEARLGIIQLVVDETVSRAGAQFYDVFYQLWSPPPGASYSTLVLSEQPVPGQGTLVSVRLDGEVVFQSRLQPREEVIEQAAQQAVQTVLRRFLGG